MTDDNEGEVLRLQISFVETIKILSPTTEGVQVPLSVEV